MATFVHITSERLAKKIQKSGISVSKNPGRMAKGVFATPITANFAITHQWVREIKHWKGGSVVGVYFRLPDSAPVWLGCYNASHEEVKASEAVARVMEDTEMNGVQVVIPRRIQASEIIRIRHLPQLVGWRHYPDAHGKRPWSCPCCQRDGYGSRKIREKYAGIAAEA